VFSPQGWERTHGMHMLGTYSTTEHGPLINLHLPLLVVSKLLTQSL
jgi:hypothetical protein